MLLSKMISKIEYTGDICDREISSLTSNSSKATEGGLFVCIKGFQSDGHDFALGAYRQGCRDFLAEREIPELPSDANVVLVKDTRLALAMTSSVFFGEPSHELCVVGITGTKGKTTTALMIKHILERNGVPTGYIGSNGVIYADCKFESMNTTPESYIIQNYMRNMVDAGIKCLVIEVSSQALELHRVDGMDFDICLFTNFSPDHIGGNEHPDLEAYFNAKKKLFDNFAPKYALVNADDEMSARVIADCTAQKITFSLERDADSMAKNIEIIKGSDGIGVSFDCLTRNGKFPCRLAFPGEFNVYNALSAISTASLFGIDEKSAAEALGTAQIDGRFEVYRADTGASFVIDYAHNGKSLTSVLKTLRKYTDGRLICLFGSVGGRTQIRRTEMGDAASRYADFSILTADNPDFESVDSIIDDIARRFEDTASYIRIPDRRQAIEYAYSIAQKGDIVLLAGKGHERYQTVCGRKEYFSEAEILKNCNAENFAWKA